MHGKIKETASHGTLVRHSWVEILGNVTDAYLYGQILYWFTPDSSNKPRLRVFKEGEFWVAKTYKEWGEELSIPEASARKILKRLTEFELLTKSVFKFNGYPVTHVRLDWERHNQLEEKWFAEKFPEDYADLEKTPEIKTETKVKKKEAVIIFSDDQLAKLIEVWNQNRKDLPEATLTIKRKSKIQKVYIEQGLEKALEIFTRATKVVAEDDWWNGKSGSSKRYGIDSLFNDDKYISKSEMFTKDKTVSRFDEVITENKARQEMDY